MSPLENELYPKYAKLLTGNTYLSQFNKTDGFYLYNELDAAGILNFTTEQKNNVIIKLKQTVSEWHNKPEKPTRERVIRESKHRLFKGWINTHLENKADIEKIVNEILNK